MQNPRDELIGIVEARLRELVPGLAVPRAAAADIVQGWRVERKFVEYPLAVQDVYLAVTLPAREWTDAEKAELDKHAEKAAWAADPQGPPPAGIGWLALLGQRRWWMSKDGTAWRVKDMHATHLANTLALLERSAARLQLRAGRSLANAPDEVQDEFDQESPEDWLNSQPLVVRMRKELKRRERQRADEL